MIKNTASINIAKTSPRKINDTLLPIRDHQPDNDLYPSVKESLMRTLNTGSVDFKKDKQLRNSVMAPGNRTQIGTLLGRQPSEDTCSVDTAKVFNTQKEMIYRRSNFGFCRMDQGRPRDNKMYLQSDRLHNIALDNTRYMR